MIMLNWSQGTLQTVQNVLVRTLTSGLFVDLNQSRQLSLCSLLLDVGCSDTTVSSVDIVRRFKH